MLSDQGKKRVVIEKVTPEVNDGRLSAKRTVGEQLFVSADIFADGHDHLRAMLLYKKTGGRKWNETEMHHINNDRWEGSFITEEEGEYVYSIKAWIDHFLTWHEGFRKKADAGQDLKVELQEGAAYLRSLAKTSGKNNDFLIENADVLDKQNKKAVQQVLSDDFRQIVKNYPMVENETIYKELEVIVERKKARFSSWYEFFPRSASDRKGKHGSFKDCLKLLPRIKSMGFDTIYLPPIHPIGEVNRKGKNNAVKAKKGDVGSPWAIGSKDGGHKSIHPELGSEKDLVSLVKKAKKMDIDIALDIAFQCAPDHPYVKEHPEWFKWKPDGTVQYAENPPKKYQDILPLNFETEDWENLWLELKSVIVYWIKKGINVFRVDNPHTKPIPFWEWVLGEIKKEYPQVIFLSEAFTRPKVMVSLAKIGFTQSYTYFTWRTTKQEIIDYMNDLVFSDLRNYFRPNFWPNTPDILPYHLQRDGENVFISRFALASTLSSNYGIYGPVYEFCENTPVPDKEEYLNSEKYELKKYDWNKTTRVMEIITLVNKARNENEALQNTWNIWFCEIANNEMIAYLKTTPDLSNIILVVVNIDAYNKQSGFVQIPVDLLKIQENINLKLHDLVTGEKYTWTEEWNYIELDPNQLPFHLFKIDIKESNL